MKVKRKFLYIYGGYSFKCETSCYDLWRYEIPFAPLAYYPINNKGSNIWQNAGNHWALVNNDVEYSPGSRLRHSMITHQGITKDGKGISFIYIFGGVIVNGSKKKP